MPRISVERADWMARAACRGANVDDFVPETRANEYRKQRLSNPPDRMVMLCAPCPVHIECFRHGIRTKSNGWWGGVLLHNGRLVQDDGHVTLRRRRRPHAAPGEGLAYFEAEFERDTDECQRWPHGTSSGYGVVMMNRRPVYVHILSCELAHGPRPDGCTAQHTCGQRACFNKRHLYWGPAMSPTARLTPDQVREIRRQRTAGVRRDDVAKEFDLAPNTVSVIASGRRWASIQ